MIMEDDPPFWTFPIWRFLLAVVEGEGTQIVGDAFRATDGDVADRIFFEVAPNAIAVVEISGDVDVWIGDKGLRGQG